MVLTAPHPLLRQKAKPVKRLDKKVLQVIANLKKTLLSATNPPGLGLSAPQIGSSLRIFIINLTTVKSQGSSVRQSRFPASSSQTNIQVFINSHIAWHSKEKITKVPRKNFPMEGCLSVPGIYGFVPRWKEIKIKYQSLNNSRRLINKISNNPLKGLLSTVFQHELDHLDGILFVDRVLQNRGKLYKMKKTKNGKNYFEEIPITDF